MKLAILGGSFDPVHLGHLYLADTVLTTLGYDRIILVPAFNSPFKPHAQDASAADRLDMLAAAIPLDPRIIIDDCELKRKGISYTIDTVEDLVRRYRPAGKPGLIVGDDLAAGFSQWRRFEDIIAQTDIIIARRISSKPAPFPYPGKQLENGIIDLSSSAIRYKIQAQVNWRYLVPEGARFIIEERRLYGYAPRQAEAPDLGPLIVRVEAAVRAMSGASRFLHSRSTAVLSHDLCLRFGLVPEKGYLAGIAHDMAKALPEEELRAWAKRDGLSITKLEQEKPSLLHARAGAAMAREYFQVEDEEILEAIRDHTTGRPGMGNLAKIVYIADKIEMTRSGIKEELRDTDRYGDLDSLFTAVLEDAVAYLRSRRYTPSEGTLRLLKTMRNRSIS
ncbi:MAG: nicotinate (nicotinamide) nucleotide adenylyltransferase [Treponema sp.]|nr:nicotinate (nicotinamide) nucleotide adenylyltransferase [Treponema sp.]